MKFVVYRAKLIKILTNGFLLQCNFITSSLLDIVYILFEHLI